jgi:hypothetical protein
MFLLVLWMSWLNLKQRIVEYFHFLNISRFSCPWLNASLSWLSSQLSLLIFLWH